MVPDDSALRRSQAMQEMLRLARAIVADDEVSNLEAKMFRSWLERHPDLADVWPVNRLKAILGDVFRNGTLGPSERQELRDLLARVGGTD